MVLGSHPKKSRDVLDATMPQLRRFNGGITPSIILSQRVEQPLHHPFDARCIRVHKALLDADPKARCLLSYRKKTGKLYRDCSLLADEHHQGLDGQKVYIATTVGNGCCLGAEPAEAAGSDKLKVAYQVFKDEACDVSPKYAPKTVSTDGWKGTQAAWKMLFTKVVILLCFLHGWLKIRDRAKHLKEVFAEVSRRVWDTYHAPDRRSFAQRLRSLRQWAAGHLTGIVLEKVLDLCGKRDRWSIAYRHPGGHRTSNMLDRLMRGMNRYFDQGQHLHGSLEACRLHCRAWALLCNFTPWHPAVAGENQGWRCPAERLNQHRYHDCWLQNLLISASLGGYRLHFPRKHRTCGDWARRRERRFFDADR